MTKGKQGNSGTYALLDSGEGLRLEQFGQVRLVRPSSMCVWSKRRPELWRDADAVYEHKKGWKFKGPRFESWDAPVGKLELKLRLQDNGQIGFFPEHLSYLDELESEVKAKLSASGQKPRVLNLFAYTGMATVACLKAGAQVTHVDLSKRALDWAKQNIELNRADESALRFIREDALSFLAKEVKRQKTYDIIIADPPSFSRVSDKETWDLDAVLHTLLRNLSCLLAGPHSSLYYTCHSTEWGSLVVENVLSDLLGDKKHRAESSLLVVQEQETSRKLPAGFLTRLSLL